MCLHGWIRAVVCSERFTNCQKLGDAITSSWLHKLIQFNLVSMSEAEWLTQPSSGFKTNSVFLCPVPGVILTSSLNLLLVQFNLVSMYGQCWDNSWTRCAWLFDSSCMMTSCIAGRATSQPRAESASIWTQSQESETEQRMHYDSTTQLRAE